MYQELKTTLYHGTASVIQRVNVRLGQDRKDFRNQYSYLKIKIFHVADIEWLDFVLLCREMGGVPHNYDMVIGPTADDNTAFCLKAYWDGLYGKIGSNAAKGILLNNLETENLGVQYYIGKQKVAEQLIASINEIDWR